LVLWDDLGNSAQGLTDREVAIFDRVFTNGTPLYFIGENLASAAANLSEPFRVKWLELIHLSPATGKGGNGTINLAQIPGNNSVLQGRFGSVQDFAYPPVLDLATSTGGTAEVLAQSGTADVLVAHPRTDEADLGEVRAFTQNVRVASGQDSASLGERKALFQNVVCWLLRCGGCGAINLAIESSGSAESVTAGNELIYSLAVHHSGECEGTGVVVTNRLPPGVQFVTAESTQGTWAYADGMVTFHLGHVISASISEMKITVVPTQAGTITNLATVRLNGPEVTTEDNSASVITKVEGSLEPTLALLRMKNGSFQVFATGPAGHRYVLETSADLVNWSPLTSLDNTNGTIQFLDSPVNLQRRFYRVLIGP